MISKKVEEVILFIYIQLKCHLERFSIISLLLLFFQHSYAQKNVKSKFLGNIKLADIQAKYGEEIRYEVEIYKLIYLTSDINEQVDTTSGLIVIPKKMAHNDDLAFPILIHQRPIGINNFDAPSNLLGNWESSIFWAGQGYVTICPDYLGYGESNSIHPFLDAESNTTSSIDFLEASIIFCDHETSLELNGQIFLVGYQEGGYYSMALQRKLQQEPFKDFEVKASAHVSAPYDLSGILLDKLSKDTNYLYPSILPLLVMPYLEQNSSNNTFENVFNSSYLEIIKEYYLKERNIIASNLCDIDLIYSDTGQNTYNMVPNSLMINDTVWMVWRTGPRHNGQADTINGGIRLAKFHKEHTKITIVEVIRSDFAQANVDTLCIDPIIGDLQDGRVVIFYTKRAQVSVPRWAEIWFRIRFPDGSYSNEKRVVGPYMPDMNQGWMVASSFELDAAGEWVLAIYGYSNSLEGAHNREFYNCELLRSNNEGNTWTHLSQLANGELDSLQYEEPQIKKLSDSRWMALNRRDDSGTISISYSAPNDPSNWSYPIQKFNGIARPCFVQTRSGDLIVSTRNHVNSIFQTSKFQSEGVYYVSKDVGKTWIGPESIAPNEAGLYMYGCPIEDEENILFIWSYANQENKKANLYKKKVDKQFLTSRSLNQKLLELLNSKPAIGILSDSLLEGIEFFTIDHPFIDYLHNNNIYDWSPNTPTRLFYCGDDKFSIEHSLKADSIMNANGAWDVMSQEIGEEQTTCDCKTEYLYYINDFFDAFRAITSTKKGIEDENHAGINIFPNPASDNLILTGIQKEVIVHLYDSFGQILKKVCSSTHQLTIDVAGLPNGSYFISIKNKFQLFTKKIILNR